LYIKRKLSIWPKGGKCVRDRGCATGRQAGRTRVQSDCYIHVGRSADQHLARIVAMIFQPPLVYPTASFTFSLSLSLSLSLSSPLFPQGVAFNRPGCSPTFSLLPVVSSLAFTPSPAFCCSSCAVVPWTCDRRRARKELRLR
jgi:hypothetical protein